MTEAPQPPGASARVERDALVVARRHLQIAKRLGDRYGAEKDMRHHVEAALAVIETALRAARSEDDTQERPIP